MNKLVVAAIVLLLAGSNMVVAQDAGKVTKIPADVEKILQQYACLACHKPDAKLIGPAYADVAKKNYKNEEIVALIYNPKPTNWPGYPPMAPMSHVPKEDALKIAAWINSLAPKGGAKDKKAK